MRTELYCGIDLHSNNSYIAIIDSEDRVVWQRRLENDLNLILEKLVDIGAVSSFLRNLL